MTSPESHTDSMQLCPTIQLTHGLLSLPMTTVPVSQAPCARTLSRRKGGRSFKRLLERKEPGGKFGLSRWQWHKKSPSCHKAESNLLMAARGPGESPHTSHHLRMQLENLKMFLQAAFQKSFGSQRAPNSIKTIKEWILWRITCEKWTTQCLWKWNIWLIRMYLARKNCIWCLATRKNT